MGTRGTAQAALCAAAVVVLTAIAPAASQAETGSFGWGSNAFGALGQGSSGNTAFDTPLSISGVGAVTQVSAGESDALARISHGSVVAWGANGHGQLGIGSTVASDVPVAVPGLAEVRETASGSVFSLALLESGTVEAWGANGEGELGQGSHTGPETCTAACSRSPVGVPGLSGVRAVAAGGDHALALLEDGTIESWGRNTDGQVGDGTTTEKDAPVAVAGITEAVAIAAGGEFSLALLADGEVRAWGRNVDGQLGNGSTTNSDTPVTVAGLAGVDAVSAGKAHALALLANGHVMAWGDDNEGQLGNGSKGGLSDVPVAVSGLSGVSSVSAGGFDSFALLTGGTGEAWGDNETGELGAGPVGFFSDRPVALACGLSGLEGIAAGVSDGYAWGAPQAVCPVVSGVAPSEGPPAGGSEVTITGSGFAEVSEVLFGSVPATSVVVDSPSEITATAPAGSETVDVKVVTAHAASEPSHADSFTYTAKPSVTAVDAGFGGRHGAGTVVTVDGTNLGNVTAVRFGATAAASFTIVNDHTLTTTAPPGPVGTVDVTVTNPSGTSEATPADHFTYEEAPEFGRCVGGGGDYSTKSCNFEGEVKLNYEWHPAFGGGQPLKKTGFTLSSATLTLESVGGVKVSCPATHGAGQFTAGKATSISSLVLTGCSSPTLGSCKSAAAAAGEVVMNPLAGQLGLTSKKARSGLGGLQVGPASGQVLAEFACGSHSVTLSGAFVGLYGKENVTTTSMSLKTKAKKGIQEQHALAGHAEASLALQVDADAAENAGVTVKLAQTNEEGVEINTVV